MRKLQPLFSRLCALSGHTAILTQPIGSGLESYSQGSPSSTRHYIINNNKFFFKSLSH